LWGYRCEGVAHRSSRLLESSETASFELEVVGLVADVEVVLAVAHHAVAELSEPSCDGKDGNVGVFVACDATVGGAQCGLGTLEGTGAESIPFLAQRLAA
jgi:hypothetical protein